MPPAKGWTKNRAVLASTIEFLLLFAFFGYLIAVIDEIAQLFYSEIGLLPASDVGIGFGLLIGLYGASHSYNKRASERKCPHCGSTFAGIPRSQPELLDSWESQEEVTEPEFGSTSNDTYDNMGRNIGSSRGTSTTYRTRTVTVPHESYLEHLKCKFCGFEWKKVTRE